MKRSALVLGACVAALAGQAARGRDDAAARPEGRFEGRIAMGPESLPVALEFTGEEELRATLDLAAERVLARPLERVRCTWPEIRASLPGVDGEFVLQGRFEGSPPGESLAGELARGSRRARLEVRRVGAPRVFPYRLVPAEFANGSQTLRGELLLPEQGGPHPAIVLLHGSSSPSRHDFRAWADALARRGVAALVYDKRTLGGPQGGRARCSLDDLARDALAGVEWLRARSDVDARRIAAFGFSEGGFSAPLAVHAAPEAFAALAVVSGPVGSYAETALWQARRRLLDAGFAAEEVEAALALQEAVFDHVREGGDAGALQRRLDDLARAPWRSLLDLVPERVPDAAALASELCWRELDRDSRTALASVRVPALFLLGEADARIDARTAAARLGELFAGRGDVEIRLLPGGDHELLRVPDAPEQVAAWLATALGTAR